MLEVKEMDEVIYFQKIKPLFHKRIIYHPLLPLAYRQLPKKAQILGYWYSARRNMHGMVY